MAQANQNPGTPPVVGASGSQDNNPEGGGEGNQPPAGGRRLIAGKYETMEDAVEHGILGMEQAYHKTREDIARLTRIMEHAVGVPNGNPGAPPMDPRGGPAPVGRGGYGYPDPYGRGAPPDPDYIDPTQFLVNPRQYLDQREARLVQRVVGAVENIVLNSGVVNEFKRQNPDLIPHEHVIQSFMARTDPTKSYAERLTDAANLTRTYLATVRSANGGNANPAPGGGNYVEPPRAPGYPGGAAPVVPGGVPPNVVDEEEKELMDYIADRNKDISARFGIKT